MVTYKMFSDRLEYALCMENEASAVILAAEIENTGYLTISESCQHRWCQRIGGWRLHTDAPWSVVADIIERLGWSKHR